MNYNKTEKVILYNQQINQLRQIEEFIMDNGRKLTQEDFDEIPFLNMLDDIQDYHTYGWYILEQDYLSQLVELNTFKIFILNKIEEIYKLDDNTDKDCDTCKNKDDELSGECYACLKGIRNYYEKKESEMN